MARALALSVLAEPLGRDGVALARSPAVLQKVTEPDAALSRGEISPREQVWNTAIFRRSFPDQWAAYLKAEYRTAYGVWKAFPGIDKSTASDWINGRRDPAASAVVAECKRKDAARQFFLGEVA